MKKLLATPAKIPLITEDGVSYVVTVNDGKPIARIVLVTEDGSSYRLAIDASNIVKFELITEDGSSYTLAATVVESAAIVAEVVIPPTPTTTEELIVGARYITEGYSVTSPTTYTISNQYISCYTEEFLGASLDSVVADPTVTETLVVEVDGYITASTTLWNPIQFKLLTPAFVARISNSLSISYDIVAQVSFKFPFKKIFYGGFLTASKGIAAPWLSQFSFPVSYGISAPLTFSIGVGSAIAAPLKKAFVIPAPMATRLSNKYSLNAPIVDTISLAHSISYAVLKGVSSSIAISYNSPNRLSSPVPLKYAISNMDRVVAPKAVSFVYVQTVVPAQHIFDPSLMAIPRGLDSTILIGATFTPNVDGSTSISTVSGDKYLQTLSGDIIPRGHVDTEVSQSQFMDIIATEPMLIINGDYVFVTEMDISIDEGNFTYTLNAKLGDYTDMARFSPNDTFYAVLQGEVYTFIVDSRSINRQEVNFPQASVKGVSLSNFYTGNRSKQIIGTTFSEGGTSRELALMLMSDNGINHSEHILDPSLFSWEILDWQIPPFRFGVENTFPLDGVKTLAEAVGGVVESYPDGRIRVRYKHPVRVPDYSDSTISHAFVDANDIISIEEQYAPNRKVDSIYVKTFQDIGVSDQIEFFDTPGLAGVPFGGFVRVFPAIWREDVELSTTRTWDVELEYMGVEYWRPGEIDPPDFGWETIEIVRSQGITRFPIETVIAYEYLNVYCGAPILQDYNKTFYTPSETERFSLIKMSYTTKCHKWRVSAPAGVHIQFLIKDNVFNSYLR